MMTLLKSFALVVCICLLCWTPLVRGEEGVEENLSEVKTAGKSQENFSSHKKFGSENKAFSAANVPDFQLNGRATHPCERPCQDGVHMVCSYTFTAEWFTTMSRRACRRCPQISKDCFSAECIAGDGRRREIITVNRQMPGPQIRVCEGDTIEVTVKNRLENQGGTAIHWHGIHQRTSPHMDGVSMVTQCPITGQTDFTYRFEASPVGTHYWHGQPGGHRTSGMVGALVVQSANDPNKDRYDLDVAEHVIIANDWHWSTTHYRWSATPDTCNATTVSSMGCDRNHCRCTHVIDLPLGAHVELIMVGVGPQFNKNHPVHIHGYAFHVVAAERYNLGSHVSVNTIKDLDESGGITRNLKTAPLRDTVAVPSTGYVVLRFTADNPGYWLFHCHLQIHQLFGMALAFKVGDATQMPAPPNDFPKCGSFKPETST